jgi:hypothetical protein
MESDALFWSQAKGGITTLLDLTPRDAQDGEFTPLNATATWWQPNQDRRIHPFTLSLQQFPLRGPATWGQRATFDLGTVPCGDLLLSTVLQVDLGHWFSQTIEQQLLAEMIGITAQQLPLWWSYAKSIGTTLIAKAELEIGDTTIETIDGDWIAVFSALFPSLNTATGISTDGYGRVPLAYQTAVDSHPTPNPSAPDYQIPRTFPTERGTVLIPLPFFYQRVRLQEALPLLAIAEGSVRIHITFRPFSECVRQLRGFRAACDATPLNTSIAFTRLDGTTPVLQPPTHAAADPPPFTNIQLLTYAANTDGSIRQSLLRSPFEILHRRVDTFYFSEPLLYTMNQYASEDKITIQLPLEINHPVEEILWFVRRKATALNNDWNNYSATLESEFDPIFHPRKPLLHKATVQLNGISVVEAEEEWFRRSIADAHKGGIIPYNSYIYGYSFARTPGLHQPSGTMNASRLQSVRLTLEVTPPTNSAESQEWEVKVFVLGLQWLRFQDGLANRMYMT